MSIPKTDIIGVGRDGSEAARRLLRSGITKTYRTESAEAYEPNLASGASDLVLVLGTMEPGDDFPTLLGSALSILTHDTLNIALIATTCCQKRSSFFNSSPCYGKVINVLDAYSFINMIPALFHKEGGMARIDALFYTARIILEMMTTTDDIRIASSDLKKTMAEVGQIWISSSISSGVDRAIKAASSVLMDQFSGNQLVAAQKILLRVVGGKDLLLCEVNDVLDIIKSAVNIDDKGIVFGVAREPVPDPVIKVSILAIHYSESTTNNTVPCMNS